ncbi:MAG TPA: SPOR domain-containing protein, partial [Lysobacter sp.]|nr:SPOR domain-containing protein [Lysobacter sp.]
PPAPVEVPPGVARLQLVGEAVTPTPSLASASAATATVAVPAPAPAAPGATTPDFVSAPVAQQCFSFGPFASRQAADAGSAKLRTLTQKVVVRDQGAIASPRGWRVFLPPLASLEEAQAAAQRIAAAGFNDFIVVREGAEANSVALGRYRNEEGARSRAKALSGAGFAARVEPVEQAGDAATAAWIDVIADESFDARRAQASIAAAQHRKLDCATLR